jgi:hypothetical protein
MMADGREVMIEVAKRLGINHRHLQRIVIDINLDTVKVYTQDLIQQDEIGDILGSVLKDLSPTAESPALLDVCPHCNGMGCLVCNLTGFIG